MKLGHCISRILVLVVIMGSGFLLWAFLCVSCAARNPSRPDAWGSEFKMPRTRDVPTSVTLSPDNTKLAVVSANHLLIRDLRSNKWLHDFGEASSAAARWHPSEPVLIAAYGSASQPGYYLAYLANGKRRQVFRGDALPVAWTRAGLLAQPAGNSETVLAIVDLRKAHVTKSGNFGHKIPWNMFPKAMARYLSPAGPDDQVAVELQPDPATGLPPHWMEMYRRVPGQKQWIRTGTIRPAIKRGKMVWYPRNPNWLGNGQLVYLRIYPAQWVSFYGSGSQLNPKAWHARNRAELWICDATGADQRKITTIWDLKPLFEGLDTDWITVDKHGRNIYYLSGDSVRQLSLTGVERAGTRRGKT